MAFHATAVTCQTRPLPAGVPAQRGTVPGVPLLKPLGGAMASVRREAPRFFSSAVSNDSAAAAGFVRPDCPPLSDDEEAPPARANLGSAASALKRRLDAVTAGAPAEEKAKPSFRSALEQASYMTATEQAGRADGRRSGKFGLGFLGL